MRSFLFRMDEIDRTICIELFDDKDEYDDADKCICQNDGSQLLFLFVFIISDAQISNARAMAVKFMGRVDEAIASLSDALTRDPTNHEFLFNRSSCYFELEKCVLFGCDKS